MRKELRATRCYPNIFCHKIINSGLILMFQVSIELYWSAEHDRIFESGTTAILVAKNGTKRLIHISVIWRAVELKLKNKADYLQIYYWHLFWCHGVIINFYIGVTLKPATATGSKIIHSIVYEINSRVIK